MVSPKRKRAKDLPKDKQGRIIIDVTQPHILEDTDYFRPSAIAYQKTGKYTPLRPNANPNSEYGKWLREEVRRCYEGYVRPSDGEWITGDMYFFLNYCPIQRIKKDKTGKSIRALDFPLFWEGHYYKSHYLEQCRANGKHAAELASRGRGKSYYAAAMLAKRFILGESQQVNKKVQCVVTASERKYIQGANQILDMFQYYIDFDAERKLDIDKLVKIIEESTIAEDKKKEMRNCIESAVSQLIQNDYDISYFAEVLLNVSRTRNLFNTTKQCLQTASTASQQGRKEFTYDSVVEWKQTFLKEIIKFVDMPENYLNAACKYLVYAVGRNLDKDYYSVYKALYLNKN